jgi:putative transposase
MARPLRVEFPGAVYHITSRGNRGERIYLDNYDREDFLRILCSVVNRFNWLCHTYCLMDNHYHLLIETIDSNLCRGMRHLNGVYTQLFNRKHEKFGHLFQGRYKAILVDKEEYLLSLCRYVVLNPVRAGLVKQPQDWKWSSYRGITGISESKPCLTTEWILSQFSMRRKEAIERYREFVIEGIGGQSPLDEVRGQILLGGKRFVERFKELAGKKDSIKEIPRVQRYAGRPPLGQLFDRERLEDKRQRDKLLFEAHIKYGYTLKEISDHLGVHYTTVSHVINLQEKASNK